MNLSVVSVLLVATPSQPACLTRFAPVAGPPPHVGSYNAPERSIRRQFPPRLPRSKPEGTGVIANRYTERGGTAQPLNPDLSHGLPVI